MSEEKTIRPLEPYRKATAGAILVRAAAVHKGIFGNPNFPAPPLDMTEFKAAIEHLAALNAEALDGGKRIIAERDNQKEDVIRMLRLIGRYVEVVCDGDMAVFRSSGLEPASSTKPQAPPLSQNIRKIEHGAISGQLVAWMKAVDNAFSYEFRYRALGTGGIPGDWTTQPVTNVKGPIVLNGLIPCTTYGFQGRSLMRDGYSDWSDLVTFICT